jgi:[acyl-carrier-protein] S-malonyltransferase
MKCVVICPGRGTYGKDQIGGLAGVDLAAFDAQRAAAGRETLTSLDAGPFAPRHLRGDNAAALIYATSLADFHALDAEVVAITGNSMGWYTALACADAVTPDQGFALADTMGTLMHHHAPGGQIIYPHMGDDWRADPARKAALLAQVADIAARRGHVLALSIDLGGMLVIAGDEAGLAAFAAAVPRIGQFPLSLPGHAAFHTGLMAPVAAMGRAAIPAAFAQPQTPLIDGRGAIWWPGATDTAALYDYTLGHQVTETYDFTHAIRIAAREFAPDLFVILGPGTTLGGATAQALIISEWQGMTSKADFQHLQSTAPVLASMATPDQRATVTKGPT